MKKLVLSILMITGLSLSSQVKSTVKINANIIENTNPIITAIPLTEPSSDNGTEYISCSAGGAYYVADGCCVSKITCSNGNQYTVIICPKEPIRVFQSARTINGSTIYDTDINIDITSNILEDSNTQLDVVSRVANQRKLLNSYITIGNDLVFNYTSSTLVIKAGVYMIVDGKLQVNCQ
jgi:hypothetical protein